MNSENYFNVLRVSIPSVVICASIVADLCELYPTSPGPPVDNLDQAQIELICMQHRSNHSMSDKHTSFNEDIEFIDTDLKHYVDYQTVVPCLPEILNEEELIEYADDGVYDDDVFPDCSRYAQTNTGNGQDIQGVMNVLGDLDACLDSSLSDKASNMNVNSSNCLSHDIGDQCSPCVTTVSSQPREENLDCWRHTALTPPERKAFCKALDSVLVTKKRRSEAHEHLPTSTPLRPGTVGASGAEEGVRPVIKSLAYDQDSNNTCEFVKFAPVSDGQGVSHFVAEPVDPHASFHRPALKHKQAEPSTPSSPKTYFASLNKSGNLSPFIRTIADKYKIFSPIATHFKKITVDLSPDDEQSYGSLLLSHYPSVCEDVETPDTSPSLSEHTAVNQMLNNYVYDVLINNKSSAGATLQLPVSSCGSDTRCEADLSMTVCLDENSVRMSKLGSVDGASDEEDTTGVLMMMTEGARSAASESVEAAEDLGLPDSAGAPCKVASPFTHNTPTWDRRLPSSGEAMKNSSFCRIPFGNDADAPPFWFSKDFGESPPSNIKKTSRIRSPKRRSSDFSTVQEKHSFPEQVSKLNVPLAFTFPASVHSPAKKRRRRSLSDETSTIVDLLAVELNNRNNNALIELPLLDEKNMGNVETYFRHISDDESGSATNVAVASKDRNDDFTVPCTSSATQPSHSAVDHQESEKKRRPHSVYFSGSLDNAAIFMDSCTEKRRSRNVLKFIKSPEKVNADNVELIGFKKLSDNERQKNPPLAVRNERIKQSLQTKPCLKTDIVMYDANFQLHPDCINRTIGYHMSGCKKSGNIPDADVENNTVRMVFGSDEELMSSVVKLEDITLESTDEADTDKTHVSNQDLSINITTESKEGTTTTHEPVDESSPDGNSQSEDQQYSVAALIESRNKLYSAISSAVEACSSMLDDGCRDDDRADRRQVETVGDVTPDLDRLDDGSRDDDRADRRQVETVGDVTPDLDRLDADLQGLDLTDTPLYANTELLNSQMKAILDEAVGSLDNILTDSFSSSLADSPSLGQIEQQEDPELDDAGENDSDGVELKEDSVLQVVGRQCVLHKEEEEEIEVLSDIADDTIEIHDDSVLNIVGTKCSLHESADNDIEPCSIEEDAMHNFDNSCYEYDEAYDIDDQQDGIPNICVSTPMQSSDQLSAMDDVEEEFNDSFLAPPIPDYKKILSSIDVEQQSDTSSDSEDGYEHDTTQHVLHNLQRDSEMLSRAECSGYYLTESGSFEGYSGGACPTNGGTLGGFSRSAYPAWPCGDIDLIEDDDDSEDYDIENEGLGDDPLNLTRGSSLAYDLAALGDDPSPGDVHLPSDDPLPGDSAGHQ